MRGSSLDEGYVFSCKAAGQCPIPHLRMYVGAAYLVLGLVCLLLSR